MSERQHAGFAQFIPGFDFLQNLAKGASASMPPMPNLSSWVAPTLDLEELDKRIGELKAVQFWIEQNRAALGATIQALEVQKMTLATLKGMDFKMADLAQAMKVKPGAPAGAAARKPVRGAANAASGGDGAQGASGQVIDPMQWWTALTQQFQQIAASAMQDVAASAQPTPRARAAPPAAAKAATRTKRAARKSAAR